MICFPIEPYMNLKEIKSYHLCEIISCPLITLYTYVHMCNMHNAHCICIPILSFVSLPISFTFFVLYMSICQDTLCSYVVLLIQLYKIL